MSSTSTSGRLNGYISIPVEIIPASNSNYHSRHNSPWKPSINRFQRRQNTATGYDRLINNSHFNRPLNEGSKIYEPNPLHFSRSSEDLLSSPVRSNTSSQNTPPRPSTYRPDSDFLQPNTYTSSLRRSFDALNDFPDMHQSFSMDRQYPFEQQQQQQQPSYRSTYETQPQRTYVNQVFINPNEYVVPTNHYQSNTSQETTNVSNDRSRSPVSQRSESPARPPPPAATSQQQESDIKLAKDVTGPSPMSGATTNSSSAQSNDQQVPSADIPVPSPAPVRDPNTVALEKLEQIKQSLAEFDQQVDLFTGSTRDDRIYKVLDEQALKIMMRCDELIDVSPDVKEKRKEMIRNVQTVLAKLESKVPIIPSMEMETTLVVYDPAIHTNEEDNKSASSQKEETI